MRDSGRWIRSIAMFLVCALLAGMTAGIRPSAESVRRFLVPIITTLFFWHSSFLN